MQIRSIRRLLGPNVWAACPVIDISLEVKPHGGSLKPLEQALEQLRTRLPNWAAADRLSSAELGDDLDLEQQTGESARLVLVLSAALQSLARNPIQFFELRPTCESTLWRLGLEAIDYRLAEKCLATAVTLANRLLTNEPVELASEVLQLVEFADEYCIGPSTMVIVNAARARRIPYRRLGELSLIQFGHGCRQRRIWTAETDSTGAIAEGISRDKHLTKLLLKAAGVPVPTGRIVSDANDAWTAAQEIGLPVVVKPLDGNHGRGVFVNLKSRQEIETAYPLSAIEGSAVIVESFAPGVEHRLLVVGDRMVACARGEYAYVVGDGERTIAELIEIQLNQDARRNASENCPNDVIEIDAVVLTQLSQEGYVPDSIPAPDVRVLVKRMGTHGPDVTADVHPQVARQAVVAAKAIGLDIAGIDIVVEDVSQPLEPQGGIVCEVNAGPQLLVHVHPAEGPGQPVGEAIVDLLFPQEATGRIPLVLLMGSRSGERIAAGVEQLWTASGGIPACLEEQGLRVAGRIVESSPQRTTAVAQNLLLGTEIDAAIWDLPWKTLAEEGFPAEQLDVLAIQSADELQLDTFSNPLSVDGLEPVVRAGIHLTRDCGCCVLNGFADPLLLLTESHSGCRFLVVGDPARLSTHSCIWESGQSLSRQDDQIVFRSFGKSTVLANWPDLLERGADESKLATLLMPLAIGLGMGLAPERLQELLTRPAVRFP